ncbi:hypothetical protein EK21DRAFT_94248 [Setomelanomma holmii]|uniref:Uncharacterized protein n=1 Tax=Setomelanomma holmii TaxID=210430 RepID=A0A9P4GZ87_9PLEO|nr:hypothetical protein EK21DRAFT_94248 [Setomelanomma holmii]
MYIPITNISTAASALFSLRGYTHVEIVRPEFSVSIALLALRQEALAPPISVPIETWVISSDPFTTIIVGPSTTSPHRTSSRPHDPPLNPTLAKPSSVPATTTPPLTTVLPTPRLTTTSESSTADESSRTSLSPISITSTPDSATTSHDLSASQTTLPSKIESAQPSPTDSEPFSKEGGKYIGMVAGIVVGSILAAILFGLLVYWGCSCYRGVNVCDCFGSRKTTERDEHHTISRATEVYLMFGKEAAPRLEDVPRPLTPPRQVDAYRTPRLQRTRTAPVRRALHTIPEM